jgi:glycosyltransferase involved in cell wall biosynthesis
MTSVVIPAHDEEVVIGRCLDALLQDAEPGEFAVVVVANGCSDATARVARSRGPDVVVLERPASGKIGALNEGDGAARGFPRIYLDADVVLTTAAARAVVRALTSGPALVAAPRPRVDTSRSSRLVAWHYQLWERLPILDDGYVGSGVYAVSAEGHRRIAPFPQVVADDHYVRRRFHRLERTTVAETFTVVAPRTVGSYLARATRAREGNAVLESSGGVDLAEESSPRGAAALLGFLGRPGDWHRLAAFTALTAAVRLRLAFVRPIEGQWGRDTSSR